LVLDVEFNLVQGCATRRGHEIAGAPEVIAPEFAAYFWEVGSSEQSGGNALERVDHDGRGDLGRHLNQEVHVIVLAIALFQGAAKVGTNRLESLSQALPLPDARKEK